MLYIFSFIVGCVIGFNVFFLVYKGVKNRTSSERNQDSSKREGAKLAKATSSEQEDLDFLNQV